MRDLHSPCSALLVFMRAPLVLPCIVAANHLHSKLDTKFLHCFFLPTEGDRRYRMKEFTMATSKISNE